MHTPPPTPRKDPGSDRRESMIRSRLWYLRAAIPMMLVLAVLTVFEVPVQAAGGDVELVAVADSYVDASRPGDNFGSSTSLRVDADPVRTGFVRFDLGGMAPPVSAVLRLHAGSGNVVGFDAHAVVDNSWTEKAITFDTAPAVGSIIGSSGPVSAGQVYEIDVTSAVSAGGPVSFAITSTSPTLTRYDSRESQNPPTLVVEHDAGVQPPPAPSQCDGSSWQGVTVGEDGAVHSEVRMGSFWNGVLTHTLDGFSFGPGTVDITELVTWDGYPDRSETAPQPAEQVRVELYLGGELVGAGTPSGDLQDGVTSAWWAGSGGSVILPDGADEVRIVHSNLYAGTNGPNSLSPATVCLEHRPFAPQPAAELDVDCGTGDATVMLTNSGDATATFTVTLDGADTEIVVEAGNEASLQFSLIEDHEHQVIVEEATAGTVLDTSFLVDCETPPTTTPPTTTPPTTTPPTTTPPAQPAPTTPPTTTPTVEVKSASAASPTPVPRLAFTGVGELLAQVTLGLGFIGAGVPLVWRKRRP